MSDNMDDLGQHTQVFEDSADFCSASKSSTPDAVTESQSANPSNNPDLVEIHGETDPLHDPLNPEGKVVDNESHESYQTKHLEEINFNGQDNVVSASQSDDLGDQLMATSEMSHQDSNNGTTVTKMEKNVPSSDSECLSKLSDSEKTEGKKEGKRKRKKADKELDIDALSAQLEGMMKTEYTTYEDCICTQCNEPLNDPRLLACLHTFCLSCIHNMIPLKSEPCHILETTIQVLKVPCPICKEETKVPVKEHDILPVNSLLTDSSHIKRSVAERLCEVCKLHNVETDAVGFCFDCKDLLCQECWDKHTFTRITLNHSVKPVEEAFSGAVKVKVRQEHGTICSIHNDEEVKYFCKNCNMASCRDCVLLDHHDHTCVSLSEIVSQKKKEYETLVFGVKDRMNKLDRDDIQKYDEKFENLLLKEQREINKVKQITNSLINNIREEEQRIINDLGQHFMKLKDSCKRRKISASKTLFHLRESLKFSEKFMSESQGQGYLELEPIFRDRLLHVLNKEVSPQSIEQCEIAGIDVNALLLDSDFGLKYPLFQISKDKEYVEENYLSLADLKKIVKDPLKWKNFGLTEKLAECLLAWDTATSKNIQGDLATHGESVVPKQNVPRTVLNDGGAENGDGSSIDSQRGPKPNTETKKKRRARKKKSEEAGKDGQVQNNANSPCPESKGDNVGKRSKKNKAGSAEQKIKQQNVHSQVNTSLAGGMPFHPNLKNPGLTAWNLFNPTIPFQSYCHPQLVGENLSGMSQEYPTPRNNSVAGASAHDMTFVSKMPKNSEKAGKTAELAKTVPPKQLVSITPKWRLDTRLDSDKYCPYITSIHHVQATKIIAADNRNNKIKIFDITGNFLEAHDAVNPTSVAYVSGCVVWTSENTVFIVSKENGIECKMTFPKAQTPHPVSWFPKAHCIVGNGNHLRLYHINKEMKNVVRDNEIFFEFPNQQSIGQIYGVKCDPHGKNFLVTDLDNKSVIIASDEGKVTGVYSEHTPHSTWLPGGACFDKKGNIFALDYSGNRLLLLNKQGCLLQQWNTSPTIENPWSVVCSGPEHLCVTGNDQYIHIYQYKYE